MCYNYTTCVVCYLPSNLPGEGIHERLHAVVRQNRRVEEELFVWQLVPIYYEAVGHQRVPVVELAELQSDTVAVLEVRAEQQGGIELELKQVSAKVLHVIFYHDSYGLAFEKQRD